MERKGDKKWFNCHESYGEIDKKFSFHFGAHSPVFRTGARLIPLDPGRVSKFQEHQTMKFGRSFTCQTEQTASGGNPILGDLIDHRCGPVYCAASSPRFQNKPSLP
ncbi:hypothetical protein AVEN_233700-1 [Araneus ventricosus]|uniref:Uncharacterized protein n=1 Tax=Araneus ventricosus TaxID=182803 RepID=A0A4Y2K668_ARAVE|nr:hypothetical protein AVEN_233700-1 [Araneus ventricosus]